MLPLKYDGLYSLPSSPVCQPPTLLPTRNEPPGVTAVAHRPPTQKRSPLPVDTATILNSALPW